MLPLKGNLRKRENERQRETRESSYAHIKAEEEKEGWKTMRFFGADRSTLLPDPLACHRCVLSYIAHPSSAT